MITGPVEGVVNIPEQVHFADLLKHVGPHQGKHRLRVHVRQKQKRPIFLAASGKFVKRMKSGRVDGRHITHTDDQDPRFFAIWLMVSLNCSAAPKKNGPLISNTSTPAGTLRSRTALGSSSSSAPAPTSSLVTILTLVTSAMRRINRNAASTIPTSIATVRSTRTVRAKVVRRTTTSLFGAVNSPRNVRHSLM